VWALRCWLAGVALRRPVGDGHVQTCSCCLTAPARRSR
jgi:hypothetical protein